MADPVDKSPEALFLRLAKSESISRDIVMSCMANEVDTVSKFLNIHADCRQEALSAAGIIAMCTRLALDYNDASNRTALGCLHMACYAGKAEHALFSTTILTTKTVDVKYFEEIANKKSEEHVKNGLMGQYVTKMFYRNNTNMPRSLELRYEDRVIAAWTRALSTDCILKPKPNPSKVVSAMDSSLDEQEHQLGNGLMIRGVMSGTDTEVNRNITEVGSYCSQYFLSLCISSSFRIADDAREGTSGFLDKVRWFGTWLPMQLLMNRFLKSLRDMHPFRLWKGCLLEIHNYIACELQEEDKPHLDDVVTKLSKMPDMFVGKETREDKIAREKKEHDQANRNRGGAGNGGGKGKGNGRNNNRHNPYQNGRQDFNYRDQRQMGNWGNPRQQQYQQQWQQPNQQNVDNRATRGCVPFFNPNDTCSKGKECPFRHTGNQPPDHAIHTYYAKAGGAGNASSNLPAGFLPLLGPQQWLDGKGKGKGK